MNDYCAFSKDHKCLKWEDYELTRHELEEAEDLCHGNWIEIQRLYDYIDKLKAILDENVYAAPRTAPARGENRTLPDFEPHAAGR